MNLRKWYGNIKIPTSWGSNAERFVGITVGMAGSLGWKRPIQVRWYDIPGALGVASRKDGVIGLSSTFFAPQDSKRHNPSATLEEAITACMGVFAHEVGHFLWTPDTIQEMLDLAGLPKNKLSVGLANLLEDLFVEHQLCKKVWPSWMVEGLWEYMVPQEKVNQVVAAWSGEDDGNIPAILNVILARKNWNAVMPIRSDFEAQIMEICEDVRYETTYAGRAAMIKRMYELLTGEESPEPQDSEEGDEGEDGDGEDSEQDGGEDGESEKGGRAKGGKSNKKGKGVPQEYLEDSYADEFEDFDVNGEQIDADKLNEIRRALAQRSNSRPIHTGSTEVSKVSEVSSGGNGDEVVLQETVEPASGEMVPAKAWSTLGQYIRALNNVRYVPGEARNYGRQMTHLHNTFSTGKVFSTGKIEAASYTLSSATPEVLLLIDYSGSMSSRLTDTIQAAYGATQAMEKGKIDLGIYGFTSGSTSFGMLATLVYEFKSFSDTPRVARQRLMNYGRLGMSGTPDAEAINFVAKKFRGSGTRVLIVLTDGDGPRPAMTKKLVDGLRKKGVTVVCVSIDKSADATCNVVYGKENVVSNEDPNVLAKVMEKALR